MVINSKTHECSYLPDRAATHGARYVDNDDEIDLLFVDVSVKLSGRHLALDVHEVLHHFGWHRRRLRKWSRVSFVSAVIVRP